MTEGILNSKPLGYASSDLANPDPITPNLLLMDRRDALLPQAVYGSSDLLGTATPDLAVGTVVMVLDSQLPMAMWPVGRITWIVSSDDGRVRSAEVDIKGNLYTRPVTKLIELPKMPDDGDTIAP
ncbi:hypothetical protein ACEWY4_019330 [Coilia grayii]|uniref:DUF5641 domain-containing protein n=1 Tax=Coilia grayii TaxID=363190 RepID=A0ABD1JI34_9TELE